MLSERMAKHFACSTTRRSRAQYLLDKGLANKILIVDLDVHQGNGTAEIFRDEPRVFTFSMHGAKNYPFRKEQSDLDIALEDNTDDRTFSLS